MVSNIAFAQESESLFIELPDEPSKLLLGDPQDKTIVRSRVVLPNPNVFPNATRKSGYVLPMNFFEGSDVNVVLDTLKQRGKDDYTWTGHIEGDGDGGTATIVVKGDVIVGNIRTEDQGYFQLRVGKDGFTEIREIDDSQFKSCGTTEAESVYAPSISKSRSRVALREDTGEIFDVMVVYTPAARIAVGGTVAMEALIDLAVSETNDAYTNSLINSQVRLVHQQEVDYTELNDNGDLERLTDPSDGFIDEVHALRDEYGADLVSMFGDFSLFCGVGWLMTELSPDFEDHAFNLVAYDCATGGYTFAHELGHNMGCMHATPETTQGTGLYNYSHGWRWINDSYRSVMAYSPGSRTPHFSNPDVLHNGAPTGRTLGTANEAHNALGINQAAYTVANWREEIPGTELSPESDFLASGERWSDFTSFSQTYTLLNPGTQAINWTASRTQGWVSLSSSGGNLAAGASVDIVVSIHANASNLIVGDYSDIVTIEDTTNGVPFTRNVELTVISPYIISVIYNSADIPKNIATNSVISSSIFVPDLDLIHDVNVTLDITHTWDSDLFVYLESPTGTFVVLLDRVGGGGKNFIATTLDDEAQVAVETGVACFSGSFRPSEALSNFDGENTVGTWIVHIADIKQGHAGTLNSWSLNIEHDNVFDKVYVDFANNSTEDGSFDNPWNSATEALGEVDIEGRIYFIGDSSQTSSTETFSGGGVIDQDVTLDALNGSATLGVSP